MFRNTPLSTITLPLASDAAMSVGEMYVAPLISITGVSALEARPDPVSGIVPVFWATVGWADLAASAPADNAAAVELPFAYPGEPRSRKRIVEMSCPIAGVAGKAPDALLVEPPAFVAVSEQA